MPVDVLALNLHHLAAAARGVERADDAVAHIVGGRELRIGILSDTHLRTPSDIVDDVPG